MSGRGDAHAIDLMFHRKLCISSLAIALALTAWLVTGCSKSGSGGANAGTPKSANLGVVELPANSPVQKDLGDGFTCVLTAGPLDATTFELIAVLEKAGKKVSSTRVAPATSDAPLEISFGDVRISMTPHLK